MNLACIVFAYQVIYRITVYTNKTTLFEFLFKLTNHMHIQLTIHMQYIISFVFRRLDVAVLVVFIVCIQINSVAFFVGLIFFNQGFVFLESKTLTVNIFQ